MSYSSQYAQFLAQCQLHNRCSINVYWIKGVTSYDKHRHSKPTSSLSSSPPPRTPAKIQVMALDNYINWPYTRDYSNLNFTNLAGLSKSVLIHKFFSVKLFHIEWFLDSVIMICRSVLCHFPWTDLFTVNDRVYNFLQVPVEDISKQNIVTTCFHSILTPFLSQTF